MNISLKKIGTLALFIVSIFILSGCPSSTKKVTITFNSNGGSEVASQEVSRGEKATKPINPTKEGYTFIGWYNSYDELWVFGGYSITEDVTLTAKYEANSYDITLNANGGLIDNNELSVIYNDSFDLPVPTKEGYKFINWVDSEGNVVDESKYLYTSNQTFTALYGPLFIIDFDSNGGNAIESYEGHSYQVEFLPIPTMDGGVFYGWYYGETLITAPFTYSYETNIELKASWRLTAGDYTYTELEDGTLSLVGYTGTDSIITIPSVINEKTVTTIGANAFKDNTVLTSITLPSTITTVNNSAFENCTSLTNVAISESVTSIGEWAFSNCTSLTNITFPESVTSIGELAFYNCTSLQCVFYGGTKSSYMNNVTIGTGNSLLSNATFIYERTNATFTDIVTEEWSYVLTNSNEVIGLKCLNKNIITCDLNTIFSGYILLSIGYQAFSNCRSLTNITIPESLKSIGASAFFGCTSLTSITIPESVTSIGNSTFRECISLTIYCKTASKPNGWYAFWNYSNRPVVWGYTK